jgi:hypothetical protein
MTSGRGTSSPAAVNCWRIGVLHAGHFHGIESLFK